jgi:signal transduction histidine kinase
MHRPRSSVKWLVWSMSSVAVACVAASIWLLVVSKGALGTAGYGGAVGNLLLPAIVLGLVAVGGLLGTLRPSNVIGLLFLAAAVVSGVSIVAGEVGGTASDWLSTWALYLGLVPLLVVLPLIFPDGRLLSARWRPALGAALIWLVISTLYQAVQPVDLVPGTSNPFAIGGLALTLLSLTQPLIVVFLLLGILSLGLRSRRGSSEVRHQLRWLIFSVALYAMANVIAVVAKRAGVPAQWAEVLSIAALLGIPVATLIAVLKYRLYDIDIVISRTLVYGSLAAFITGVYVAIVVGIGTLIGSGGKPNLALSILATAIVAVAFQPVRARVHKFANRLVYGERATPYEVLSQFSERVAESYAADEVLPRMARVLAEGTGALRTGVWLRHEHVIREAASWPEGSPVAEPATLANGGLPDIPGADRAIPVQHQGELLGALTITKRTGESLTPVEEKLLFDLASQAGLVLRNVGLTDELLQRLEELRASRQRLVTAQDDERRRLERDLHDGAQQHLVAIKVKLGLLETLATRDPEQARATVVELKHNADEALETLRDLARGIYPPLLADRGLAAALQSQARKATLPVTVDDDGIGRFPQETESALYFCTLEALQNVQKYAHASTATVHLSVDRGQLRVEVADDGCGYDPVATKRGSGLTNMEDRLDSLGGTLHIESTPGLGTTLCATVRVSEAAPANGASSELHVVTASSKG